MDGVTLIPELVPGRVGPVPGPVRPVVGVGPVPELGNGRGGPVPGRGGPVGSACLVLGLVGVAVGGSGGAGRPCRRADRRILDFGRGIS